MSECKECDGTGIAPVAAPLPAAPAPTEQAELLPLPTSFTQVARLDGTMCDAFTPNQMHGYARAALAHQLSRIRHLEHERDTARKDCTALAARQAPDSRDAWKWPEFKDWIDSNRERPLSPYGWAEMAFNAGRAQEKAQ